MPKLTKSELQDVAGVETEMLDFSEFDDGNGNNLAFGDLSVQRLMERGLRDKDGWPRKNPRRPKKMDKTGRGI